MGTTEFCLKTIKTVSIAAIIKTQGIDTKLVAQMHLYYEARILSRLDVVGKSIPALTAQIADGENGGVMMNEFPSKYLEVMRETSSSDPPPVNINKIPGISRYFGYGRTGVPRYPADHAETHLGQIAGAHGQFRFGQAIEELRHSDNRFHVEGGSWTNNLS